MRRIVFLTAVAVMAFAGIAYAINNTVDYKVTVKKASSKKPSAKAPVPISYTADLKIDTDPPGNQPDIATPTTVYFAKNVKQNAKAFPSCTLAQLEDGTNTFPSKCAKAKVGTGSAVAEAGSVGNPPGLSENLELAAYNGPAGKTIFLVVHSAPGAPVGLPNRAIPGTLKAGSGQFGYSVQFNIPADLQNQLGLDVSLTQFHVAIPSKTIKKNGKKISYLMLSAPCAGGSMPVKFVATFKSSDPKEVNTTAKC